MRFNNRHTLLFLKRLEKVWAAKLNSVCQYRDYYGRRIYIYRPGWYQQYID